MIITDEMVDLAAREARAWGVVSKHGEWTNEETQQQCARDILEAVAPLIAAKAWEEALQARARWMQDQRYYVEDEVPNPYRTRANRIERASRE